MAKRVTTAEFMEVLIDLRDVMAKKFESIERKLLEHDRGHRAEVSVVEK